MKDEIEKQAKANQDNARATALSYRKDLEKKYGVPIQVLELKDDNFGGTVRPVWNQHTPVKFHTVALRRCAPWLWPHKLAHELTHIELEAAAHAAGKRMTHVPGPLTSFQPQFQVPENAEVLQKLFSLSLNVPVDMIVETRVRNSFPSMAAAQCVNLCRLAESDAKHACTPDGWHKLSLAVRSLDAARALFIDHHLNKTTHYFDRFKGTQAGANAEKLYADFQATMNNFSPGDHYELVTRSSDVLGFSGLHGWDPRPTCELCREEMEIEQLVDHEDEPS